MESEKGDGEDGTVTVTDGNDLDNSVTEGSSESEAREPIADGCLNGGGEH